MSMNLISQAESTPVPNSPAKDVSYQLNYSGNQTIITADLTITCDEIERGRKAEMEKICIYNFTFFLNLM